MNQHCYTIANGITGTFASFLGVISTFQHQLEWWMRVTGGFLGIIIGVLTLWNLLKNKR
jgi:putative Mn2+ efflux pump MntP